MAPVDVGGTAEAVKGEQQIDVLCFTWNVGNHMPDERQLAAWLPEPGQAHWDIIAVGTQENAFKAKAKEEKPPLRAGDLRSLSKTSVDDPLRDSSVAPPVEEDAGEREKEDDPIAQKGTSQRRIEKDAYLWDRMVEKRLGKGYTRVKHAALWEMRLTIYAKVEWARGVSPKIHHVQVAKSATGVAGVLANKGGIVIRLDFGRTSLGFCSCHLAAHDHKLKQRNENCQEILRETEHKLGTKRLDLGSQFDHIFWMGDLNYRVDLNAAAITQAAKLGVKDLPKPYADHDRHHREVLKLVDKEEWEELYNADQLQTSRAAGDAFFGFKEAPLTFPPTFKVKRGSGSSYKDQRIPSYCDRVLWKSMPPLANLVHPTRYEALPDVTTSDHKPVLASFEVQLTETVFEVVALPRLGSAYAAIAAGLHLPTAVHLPHFSPRLQWPGVHLTRGSSTHRPAGGGAAGGGAAGGAAAGAAAAADAPAGASAAVPEGSQGRRSISGRHGGVMGRGGMGKRLKDRLGKPHSMPLVRITSLQLSELMDMDLGGGSDPYVIFFTNPPGLLSADDRHAPTTTVKKVKTANTKKKAGTTHQLSKLGQSMAKLAGTQTALDGAVSAVDVDVSLASPSASSSKPASGPPASLCPVTTCSWGDRELPLLRPYGLAPVKLPFVTLIMAVYDRDNLSVDDLLGVALVPLQPPPPYTLGSQMMPEEYTINVDQPLVHGNQVTGVGNVKATIKVSYGSKLYAALEAAKADECGVEAKVLSGHTTCGIEMPCTVS